jgi:colicin import membrane protein
MWRWLKETFGNVTAMLLAVLVHLVALAVLMVNLDWKHETVQAAGAPVEAAVVDARAVQQELAKIKEAEKRREDELKALERKKLQEQQELADIQKKQQEEARKAKQLEQERKAEEIRLTRLEEQRKKEEAEQRRKAAEAAEQKKKEAVTAKQKAEDGKKRREQEDKARAAKELQERLAAEEAEAKATAQASAQQHYVSQIAGLFRDNWRVPLGAKEGLCCKFVMRLTPAGDVVMVKLLEGSGNPAMDQAAEAAILRSSPLPKPPPGMPLEFRFNMEYQKRS